MYVIDIFASKQQIHRHKKLEPLAENVETRNQKTLLCRKKAVNNMT